MSYFVGGSKAPTLEECIEAVRHYGESGNAQEERVVFLTPRLHLAILSHLRDSLPSPPADRAGG